MAILTPPRSLHNNDFTQTQMGLRGVITGAQSNHPSFPHLVLLVFEAVLEVICVSLPGYIAARQGMFDADAQKLVANLNVTLFTPCLSMQLGTELVQPRRIPADKIQSSSNSARN